jgi:hypothetical protein
MRKWRKNNPEKSREVVRLWRLRNRKKVKAMLASWYKRNRKRHLAYMKKYYRKNRSVIRTSRYDLSRHDYLVWLKEQKGRCAICRKKFRKTPHIDHDHKTKKNRGLLCGDCNRGLGGFKDSIRILLKAIEYLKGTS